MKNSVKNITNCVLKYYMDEQNMGYFELSNKTGISISSLKRYAACQKYPEINRAFQISMVLGVPIDKIWPCHK